MEQLLFFSPFEQTKVPWQRIRLKTQPFDFGCFSKLSSKEFVSWNPPHLHWLHIWLDILQFQYVLLWQHRTMESSLSYLYFRHWRLFIWDTQPLPIFLLCKHKIKVTGWRNHDHWLHLMTQPKAAQCLSYHLLRHSKVETGYEHL